MITALHVANTFLEKSKRDNINVTPMKLQKLIYILYKEYLKKTKTRLFEEKFEVWKYGPVIHEVYVAFRIYRSNVITDFYYNNTDKTQYTTVELKKGSNFNIIFNQVWEKYGSFSGIYLSQLTHQQDTAWSLADERGDRFLLDEDIISEKEYL